MTQDELQDKTRAWRREFFSKAVVVLDGMLREEMQKNVDPDVLLRHVSDWAYRTGSLMAEDTYWRIRQLLEEEARKEKPADQEDEE